MRTLGKAFLVVTILAGFCSRLGAQTNPVPFLNNPLVPGATPPGGPAFTLTLNGAGFVANSVVNWNGSARATTFVSPTKLTAAIPASDIATTRTVLVTVSNPAPGGGNSDARFFGVTIPATTLSFIRTDVANSLIIDKPAGMTEGDFDRNNIPDLAIANDQCPAVQQCTLGHADLAILPNGSPEAAQPGLGRVVPAFIVIDDFNGDGFLDLLTVNGATTSAGPTISTVLGNGDGTFQAAVNNPMPGGLAPGVVATGDFNRDGKLDLVMTNPSGVSILPGNGDGTFGMPTSYATGNLPIFVAVGDLNGDGKLDLAVTDGLANTVSILLGNGDGTFQAPVDYAAGPLPWNIVVADFNGDSKLDLAVVNNNTEISIYLGNGDGTFQPRSDYPAADAITSITTGDFNGDGLVDVAVSGNAQVSILVGNGNGTFQSHLDFAVGSGAETILAGDYSGTAGKSGFATLNSQDDTVSIFSAIASGPVNPLPTISSISPASVGFGSGGLTLTVTGTNFVSGASVVFGGTPRQTTFVSSTQLTAAIFSADVDVAGSFAIAVLNPAPGGGDSTSIAFNVLLPPPAISSLGPAIVVAGGPTFTLAVNGSNFVLGALVNVNGLPRNAAFVSSAQVTIPISAGDIASQGSLNISVTDPVGNGSPGGTTPPLILTILATNTQPVIGALVPASATAGGPAFTLILTGTGFTPNSVVTFKSTPVSAAYKNATQLQAAVPASAIAVAGTPLVIVANPGGSPSLVTTFTVNNPVPGASDLSTKTVAAGNAALTLTVTGTNFNSSSTVLVGGSPRPTTFSNPASLTAALPAGDFAHSGILNIAVKNPLPGGGTTSALAIVVEDFNVTIATPTASVVAGNSATFNLMLTPSNATTANPVTFTVSGVPAGATSSFSPSATIPAGSGATSVMLSVATTAHSAAPAFQVPGLPWPYLLALYLAGLAILLCLGLSALTWRVPRLAPQLLLVFLLVIVGGLLACGGTPQGAAAPSVNPATGTAAGVYSIVVTSTAGGGSLTTNMSLTVN